MLTLAPRANDNDTPEVSEEEEERSSKTKAKKEEKPVSEGEVMDTDDEKIIHTYACTSDFTLLCSI